MERVKYEWEHFEESEETGKRLTGLKGSNNSGPYEDPAGKSGL